MTEASGGGPARPAVDLEILSEATGGDRDLMQELAELYVNDADLQLRALSDALENKEMDRLRRIGHALKGSSLSIGASVAGEIFQDLETAGKEGDLPRAISAIERGRVEFIRVREALSELR